MEVVVKIALHVNDIAVILFLQNGKEISDALFIMEGFSGISGLGINKAKSEAMWLCSKVQCLEGKG